MLFLLWLGLLAKESCCRRVGEGTILKARVNEANNAFLFTHYPDLCLLVPRIILQPLRFQRNVCPTYCKVSMKI